MQTTDETDTNPQWLTDMIAKAEQTVKQRPKTARPKRGGVALQRVGRLRPSREPQMLHADAWYYEKRGGIELVIWHRDVEGKRTTVQHARITWNKLLESARRCVPDRLTPAEKQPTD